MSLRQIIRLNDRDMDILHHVARYKMTVPKAVATLPIMDNPTAGECQYALRRLREAEYLETDWLYGGISHDSEQKKTAGRRCYYHLSPAGTQVLALPHKMSKPLKPIPKYRAYAILSFCCLDRIQRTLLTITELKDSFPELWRWGQRSPHYLDREGESPQLAFLRVDAGGRGRWDRMVNSIKKDIRRWMERPAFCDHVTNHGFTYTIITAFQHKAKRLEQVFSEMKLPVDIRLHVVADLIHLIAPELDDTDSPSDDS